MSSRPRRLALAALALAAGATPALAQRRTPYPTRPAASARPALIELTPYAGVVRFGTLAEGPLGSSLRPALAPVGGAQAAVHLTPALSLVGNVAYGRGDLQVGVPLLGGLDIGGTSAWLYDAGLEYALRATEGSPIVPFVQAGGGAITQRLSVGPLATTRTNAAFNAGAGVDIALGRGVGVRLLAKDYVGRFDAGQVGDLRLRGDVAHNLAFTAGLRLAF
jgi:hypothetical protein